MRGTGRITKVAELALIGSMILSACVAPAGALSQGTKDRSQDQAERTRSLIGAAAKPDTSYNQVEKSRGTAFGAADTSYNEVEKTRARATGQ